MDPNAFESTLSSITVLNASEGPNSNIFEPKFQAREQAESLRKAIYESFTSNPSLEAQEQLARVDVFLGNNQYETEEEKEAIVTLCRAVSETLCCTRHQFYDYANDTMLLQVNDLLALEELPAWDQLDYRFVETYVEAMNCLGVVLSSREGVKLRVNDAKKILHFAERTYFAWDRWAVGRGIPKYQDLPLNDHGDLIENAESSQDLKALQARLRMEALFTSTLYYLAQAHAASGDVNEASRYCHHTMARQLISKKEFNKKDWALNALHLSGFYASNLDWGAALHCIQAAEVVMPKVPDDEEHMGTVVLAKARFHKMRLRRFSQLAESAQETGTSPQPDACHRAEWWENFRLPISAPQELPPILGFDAARECFKVAMADFVIAQQKYFVFEGCCTEHISVAQDVAELYKDLIAFEGDLDRKIAMHQKRLDALLPFPEALNFNAYGTLVRQLTFDIGDIMSDILDLRVMQRQTAKGLSDKKMNELSINAQKQFLKFFDSYKENGMLPKKLDTEMLSPLLRALMRVARLEGKRYHKSPEEEYQTISNIMKRYEEVIQFAVAHDVARREPALAAEVNMCREMLALLPGKQRDLWKTFHK